jgi:hypothetical protein
MPSKPGKIAEAATRAVFDQGVADGIFTPDSWEWWNGRTAESLQLQLSHAKERRTWFARTGSTCEHEWIYQAHIDSFGDSIIRRFCIKCGGFCHVTGGYELHRNWSVDSEEYTID